MKALKTIVATAVIVFALTTVAMAGVQHFTKQSGQSSGAQTQTAQKTYSVTLTAAQLQQLIGARTSAAATQHKARHAESQQHEVTHERQATRSGTHSGDGSTHVSYSVSGGAGSSSASHHSHDGGSGSGSHHSGDCDGGCW
jgi:hypothetical protein